MEKSSKTCLQDYEKMKNKKQKNAQKMKNEKERENNVALRVAVTQTQKKWGPEGRGGRCCWNVS